MNAKTCKRLRRAAENASVGMPARRLIAIGQRVNQAKHAQPQKSGVKPREYRAECAMNDPQSTRGFYRAMKKALV